MNHTQKGIGHKPAGQGEGEQGDGKWRRNKRAWDMEWELHNHCLQARQLHHEQKVADWTGHVDNSDGDFTTCTRSKT
jgi:hypothetical protein